MGKIRVLLKEGQILLRNPLQCLLVHYQKNRDQHRQMIGPYPDLFDLASSVVSPPRTDGKSQPPQIKRLGMDEKNFGAVTETNGLYKNVSDFTNHSINSVKPPCKKIP